MAGPHLTFCAPPPPPEQRSNPSTLTYQKAFSPRGLGQAMQTKFLLKTQTSMHCFPDVVALPSQHNRAAECVSAKNPPPPPPLFAQTTPMSKQHEVLFPQLLGPVGSGGQAAAAVPAAAACTAPSTEMLYMLSCACFRKQLCLGLHRHVYLEVNDVPLPVTACVF